MDSSLISHIGVAVADLDEAINRYQMLTGRAGPKIESVPDQGVKVAIFSDEAGSSGGRIELVAATSPDSPIARFIERKGEGLHHICIYVDDLKSRLAELRKAGVKLIDETPRVGAEGGLIAFVHPASCNGVLIELEERR